MKKSINYILLTSILLFTFINNVDAAPIVRECVTCGADSMAIPSALPNFVAALITFAQIMVPIILIVFGMIRYIRAVASGEDKVIQEVNRSFIKSIIAAVAVFLVVSIVRFTFSLVDSKSDDNKSTSCISCFITGDCTYTACPSRDGKSVAGNEACYQCQSNPSIYKWGSSSSSDSSCPGGYHTINKSQADCHS